MAVAWIFLVMQLNGMRGWSEETGLPWIGIVDWPPPGNVWIYVLGGIALIWAIFGFLRGAWLRAAKRRLARLEKSIDAARRE